MPFRIIRDDITRVHADAIVNTANPEPTYARGTDMAVYMAAGVEPLLEQRKAIGKIAPGDAAATDAFALPARHIIHTVGPVWIDGEHGEFETLASCYRKSLELAEELGCESIAFPLISTGTYGFPKDRALDIALATIREFLEGSDFDVTLVVFDSTSFKLAEELRFRVAQYIDEQYVAEQYAATHGLADHALRDIPEPRSYGAPPSGVAPSYPSTAKPPSYGAVPKRSKRRRRFGRRSKEERRTWERTEGPEAAPTFDDAATFGAASVFEEELAEHAPAPAPAPTYSPAPKAKTIEDAISHLGESFQERLFRMIDERGLTDPQVYKRANVDRKLFSKIRCNEGYIPKKRTIIALAIALQLNIDDTRDLLASAGFALTNNSKSDVIASFCIENGIYDIFEVNALLFEFDEPILA
ncbi:MAG: macro domain-containing protein [bacterium]|nr:macro domain-containing protein [bacterium]